MKRDWDTIRELLVKVEACTLPAEMVDLSQFPDDEKAAVSYHMQLLIEAGLVHGKVLQIMGREAKPFMAQRLTWQGHELLDSIRNETVWQRVKKGFVEKGIDMSFDLVKSAASDVAGVLLKGALGGS